MELEDFNPDRLAEQLQKRRYEHAQENELFYEGDHLMAGDDYKGYIGILPQKGDDEYTPVTKWLERVFSASNKIAEVVDRHVDGILGREPDWQLVPTDADRPDDTEPSDPEEDDTLREAYDALVDWWNDRKFTSTIFKPVVRKGLLEKKAVVRAFIPPGFVDENGNIERTKTLREALDRIYFEVLHVEQAGVFVDDDKRETFSVYQAPKTNADEATKVIPATKSAEEANQDTEGHVELTFVNDDGLTELHAFDDDGDEKDATEPVDLNKMLYVFEFEVDLMITEPVRSLQRSINYAITTMNKNLNVAGSRDTYVTNAQPPQRRVEKRNEAGKVIGVEYIDEPIAKGGSRVNFLAGLPSYDKDGNVQDYSTAGVTTVDPVAVDTFIKARDAYRADLLEEVHQSHVLINDDATPSGKSRQEARAEHRGSLQETKGSVDDFGRWFIAFSLQLGAVLSGQPDKYKNYRVDFNAIIYAGAETSEEREARKKDLDDGLISLETYLVDSGVEDPDAEFERLKTDERFILNMLKRRLEVINEGLDILPNERIAELLEPDDEEKRAALLKAMEEDVPPQSGGRFGEDPIDDPNNPQPDDLPIA